MENLEGRVPGAVGKTQTVDVTKLHVHVASLRGYKIPPGHEETRRIRNCSAAPPAAGTASRQWQYSGCRYRPGSSRCGTLEAESAPSPISTRVPACCFH